MRPAYIFAIIVASGLMGGVIAKSISPSAKKIASCAVDPVTCRYESPRVYKEIFGADPKKLYMVIVKDSKIIEAVGPLPLTDIDCLAHRYILDETDTKNVFDYHCVHSKLRPAVDSVFSYADY